MLHFNLSEPVGMLWFGEFVSPEHGWRHLTRQLFEYEMMIVTSGELYIADEDTEYHVKAGEYLIMSPTRHQHGTRVCRCQFYWMHFRCPALPASVSLPPQGKVQNGENIKLLSEMLLSSEAEEARSVRSVYLATQILLELARGQSSAEKSSPPRSSVCESVKNYVTYHRFSQIMVSDIARALGYHEKYLSALFHREEGMTIKAYIDGRRLEEAKRLLLETDYTVSQISYYLNFPSPHNFARFFKAHTGMTAGDYRIQSTK